MPLRNTLPWYSIVERGMNPSRPEQRDQELDGGCFYSIGLCESECTVQLYARL